MNNEDKIYALLEKIYTELQDTKKELKKDIKFIKHKLHQTEEDVFDIKDYLKIIK